MLPSWQPCCAVLWLQQHVVTGGYPNSLMCPSGSRDHQRNAWSGMNIARRCVANVVTCRSLPVVKSRAPSKRLITYGTTLVRGKVRKGPRHSTFWIAKSAAEAKSLTGREMGKANNSGSAYLQVGTTFSWSTGQT